MNISRMGIHDLAQVSVLCLELGYTCSVEFLTERLSNLPSTDHLFVIKNDVVCGFIHLKINEQFIIETRLEIAALVISKEFQRMGFGEELVRFAEAFANQHKLTTVFLRSGEHRTAAHNFYKKNSFSHIKTGFTFSKSIS